MLHKLPICPKIQRWAWCQWKWGFQDTFKDTGKCSPYNSKEDTQIHTLCQLVLVLEMTSLVCFSIFQMSLKYFSDESIVFLSYKNNGGDKKKLSLISHFKCKMVFWNVYCNENTFELILLLAVNSYMKCTKKYLLLKYLYLSVYFKKEISHYPNFSTVSSPFMFSIWWQYPLFKYEYHKTTNSGTCKPNFLKQT